MKHKKWPIYIWFLDDDLAKSASYLTDKELLRSIDGCVGSLLSAYFYIIGVRTKKFYDYYFSKENADETMMAYFPCWPMKKKPSFAAYGRKESKWCRSCLDNFNYTLSYLEALLDELSYRHGKMLDEKMETYCWVKEHISCIDLPFLGLGKVILPWKVIDPKFRRIDVIEGYRLQYVSSFKDVDPFAEYGTCIRDIPEFVIDMTHSNDKLFV